jgi:flagellar biosynthesis/type III secretory pathway protein FliH
LGKGIKIGKEEVQKKSGKKKCSWEQELREIYNYREEMVEKLKEPLFELGFAIARKIIGREAEREPLLNL